ncbi:hypothetical protein FEM48_Zijuj06G0153600 [Ziziphus jujuba var. spinosa]|uniref:Uncharacterized protein n=1 Tax=Ziziphus jujuba var. spinosa TaxID=714518 RepID=A0A978VA26_ZIZJJ|nr:hypothetical protein FEM48_Zijuj06G0153600 [Ziziphus jujuba var. spinosa]
MRNLNIRYASYSRSQLLELRTQLQSTEKGDMSINEFWFKMKMIVDKLEAMSEFVHETDFAFYILRELGLEFDTISENLNSRYNVIITMNIGNNNSANIVNTTHHIGVDAVFGMSYVLGQSSSANSKNSSVNHVGLSVSSLGPLAFNVSIITNLMVQILNVLLKKLEAIEVIMQTPPFQQHPPILQGYDHRGFLAGIQSGFPSNPTTGQYDYGSQMLTGNFANLSGTPFIHPVGSVYPNVVVSPGIFVQIGFNLPGSQLNNVIG